MTKIWYKIIIQCYHLADIGNLSVRHVDLFRDGLSYHAMPSVANNRRTGLTVQSFVLSDFNLEAEKFIFPYLLLYQGQKLVGDEIIADQCDQQKPRNVIGI